MIFNSGSPLLERCVLMPPSKLTTEQQRQLAGPHPVRHRRRFSEHVAQRDVRFTRRATCSLHPEPLHHLCFLAVD